MDRWTLVRRGGYTPLMRMALASALLLGGLMTPPSGRAQDSAPASGRAQDSAPASGRAQDSAPPPSVAPTPTPTPTAAPPAAPSTAGRLSDAGIYRAAALVDSVYVDRLNPSAFVEGGDFASYLVARLGVRPIPNNLAIDVAVDSTAVTLSGRVQDLPEAVRAQLGPALMFLDPSSVIAAEVSLLRSRVGVVRFHLRSLLVNGVALPEGILVPLMAQVGANYPALTSTGRDLLVAIPEDGTMRLAQGGVRVAVKTVGTRAGTH